MDLERGTRIGKYTIVKRLSVGGMAEVFLAIAEGPGGFKKVVTLKRILPQHREDEEFVAMFLEEARISAALSHAHIAQVFDLGHEPTAGGEDELFLAMEFVPGEDISQIRRSCQKTRGAMPLGFAVMVARDALLALHYAHTFVDASGARAPIVHRDVSPKNIMVTYAGSVKVIDFGIAKALGSLTLTESGMVKGSTGYMSPEQSRGDPVDGRSDLFSVGVQLHELLTGKRLFGTRDASGMAVLNANNVEPPHVLVPSVPPALGAVVMRALAFDPAERFQSARDMARALDDAAGPAFDEEQASALMRELFKDNMDRTREALQLAGRARTDTGKLRAALQALPDDPSTGESAPQRPAPGSAGDKVPPLPVGGGDFHEAVTEQATPVGAPATREGVKKRRLPERPVVLAVDDSAASLQIFKIHMTRQGFEVVGCSSPKDALEAIRAAPPDVVVLDVMMPEMDGFELCRRVRDLPQAGQLPILFLSAACSLEERTKGLDVGGDDFIRKPYEPEDLAARIRTHLARVAVLGSVSEERV